MSIMSPASQNRGIVPLEEFERRYILEVLKATNWHLRGDEGAAIWLGLLQKLAG